MEKDYNLNSGLIGTFKYKHLYVYYSPFTNKDNTAIVTASSKDEAINKLTKYYANISDDHVKEVYFNNDDICIIPDIY